MRKTKIEITCDDCGTSLIVDKAIQIPIQGQTDMMDFCRPCVIIRVQHSLNKVPLNRVCKNCNGRGKVQESYGHNERDWVQCENCKGSKILPLC